MNTALRSRAVRAPALTRTAPPRLAIPLNAAVLVCLLVLLFVIQPSTETMKANQVAPTTVVAQRKVTYVDHVATAARREQIADTIPAVYRYDAALARTRFQQAQTFLSKAAALFTGNQLPPARLAAIDKLLPTGLTNSNLQELPSLSLTDYRAVQTASTGLLAEALTWRFNSDQLTSTEISLLSTLPPHTPIQQRTAIGEVINTFLTPTLVQDAGATAQRRKAAIKSVPLIVRTIYSGQVIVRRGDIVTPEVVEQLDALGLQQQQAGWQSIAGSVLFAVVIIAMLFWYLLSFHPSIAGNVRLLLLIDLCLLVAVAGTRLLSTGHSLLPLFFPVAAASTFAAVLIAPEACIAIALVMALLAGWVVANSFELTIYYLVTGAAGVLTIRHVRRLQQFVVAGIAITTFAFLTLLAFGFVEQTYDMAAIQDFLLAATFNGFLSSTLALGGFALLAEFFGVTTALRLLELAQPNQPLLHRLMVRAPGTYHHGLILSSMVERAAEEIGANSLVTKVGALYHDVGKVNNPHCFAENQMGGANIHDELLPEESARIIRGHVSQGVRLARQFKLPRVILDAILEHHGTMSIAYFLHKARTEQGDDVDISLYSYPGPKPQSKETALIMLADGCESAVRAAPDHTSVTIRTIVDRIFRDRIDDGQLDECPLTLRDLDRIKATYCSVLNGLYHPRIEYPEPAEQSVLKVELGGRG